MEAAEQVKALMGPDREVIATEVMPDVYVLDFEPPFEVEDLHVRACELLGEVLRTGGVKPAFAGWIRSKDAVAV